MGLGGGGCGYDQNILHTILKGLIKWKKKIEKNEIIAERKRGIQHSLSSVIIIAVKKSK